MADRFTCVQANGPVKFEASKALDPLRRASLLNVGGRAYVQKQGMVVRPRNNLTAP